MAQSSINVSLPEELKKKASERVTKAQYSNVSDYIRDLIRRDIEQHDVEAQLAILIREGLSSGTSDRDPVQFIEMLRASVTAKNTHG